MSAIALSAKAYWGYPPAWLEQWREHLTITPDFVAANETFAAIIDRQPAGFYSLLSFGNTLRLEHLWVLPEQIGRGIGRALFKHALQRAARTAAVCLTIESDPNAEPFYLQMGAIRVGTVPGKVNGLRRELPLLTFDLRPLQLAPRKRKTAATKLIAAAILFS